MLANKMHKFVLGSATQNVARGLIKPFHRSVQPGITELFQQPVRSFATENDKKAHAFSSMAAMSPGTIEKPLHVLDMAMVRKIKAELMEVDANSDGRYGNI